MINKKYIINILRPLRKKYIFAITLGLIANLLAILSTFILQILIDLVLPKKNVSLLLIFILGYLSFHVFRSLISLIKEVAYSKHGYKLLFDIRNDMYSSIINKIQLTSFNTKGQGYIITLFRDWLTSISWFLSNILLNTITDSIMLIISLVILACINFKIFIVTAFTLPLYGVTYLFFNKRIRDTRMEMMNKDVAITQKLTDTLDSIKEIRIFNSEENFTRSYNYTQQEFADSAIKHTITTSTYDSLSKCTTILGNVIVLYFGSMEVISGSLSIGSLLALNSIVALLYSPVERIVNFNRLIQVFKVNVDQLTNFMSSNVENINIHDKADYQVKKNDILESDILRVEELCYSFEELKVLDKVNLNIKFGNSYAIVGQSGCGKSTLINLLTGLLIPKKGNIYYNGINIHEDIKSFRSDVGYVPQDTIILNDTLIKNIIFGREENKKQLDKLIKLCEIDTLMLQSELKLDSILGEKGSKISGGQKQKIALCRALFTEPSILVIDEGTSSLDLETESRILFNIKKEYPKMTILLTSHRLSSVKIADEIIVINNNRIEEIGSLNQLSTGETQFNKIFSNLKSYNKKQKLKKSL